MHPFKTMVGVLVPNKYFYSRTCGNESSNRYHTTMWNLIYLIRFKKFEKSFNEVCIQQAYYTHYNIINLLFLYLKTLNFQLQIQLCAHQFFCSKKGTSIVSSVKIHFQIIKKILSQVPNVNK